MIDEETDSSDESSDVHKDFAFRGPKQQPQESFSSEQRPRSLSLSKQKEPSSPKQQRRSSTPEQQQNPSSPKAWPTSTYVIIAAAVVVAILYLSSKGDSHSSATDTDWRSKIDPNEILSNNQRSMIRASLKPILDKSFKKDQDVGVSTLLILSSDEKSAAELARCLLGHINKKTDVNQVNLFNIENKI